VLSSDMKTGAMAYRADGREIGNTAVADVSESGSAST
jgi:hypothetical protein